METNMILSGTNKTAGLVWIKINRMFNCYRSFYLLLTFLLFVPDSNAQDPVFSQHTSSYLYRNPGFSGILKEKRISLVYRNQWPGSLTRYETFYASYDQPVEVLHGGIGFIVFNDYTGKGMVNNFHFSAIYAYHLRVSDNFYIQAGFQVSLNQRNVNNDLLVFPDMINPSGGGLLPTQEVLGDGRKFFMDYSVGFTGYGGNWFGGLAVFHLAQPIQSDSGNENAALPRKYTAHLARNIFLSGSSKKEDSWVLTPLISILGQKTFQNLNYGLIINRNQISAGIAGRHDFQFDSSSLIISVGFSNLLINLAYSYDVYVGDRTKFNPAGGAHEVSMIVRLPYNKMKSKTKNTIKLPVL
jgi:type IX secretion system PorP/SprF family membrane protein